MLTQFETATSSDLATQANKIINAVPASDPLYVALYKAEHNFEVQDYITITDQINATLLQKGIDASKLPNSSFLNGSTLQKYFVMGEQYTKLKGEAKVKAEYEILVKNANNAIITVLKDPKHLLYARLHKAKTKASERDYLDITLEIDDILMGLNVDFLKLKDKSFLNGTAFQPYYLLPDGLAAKLKQTSGVDLLQKFSECQGKVAYFPMADFNEFFSKYRQKFGKGFMECLGAALGFQFIEAVTYGDYLNLTSPFSLHPPRLEAPRLRFS